MTTPTDLEMIQSVVARVAHHIDRKEWTRLRSLYAGEVSTDYTSLFGGTPQRQAGDDLIGVWNRALGNVQTQHLLGPIDVRITGSAAVAECHVRAWHYAAGARGGEEWVVAGHYVFALAKSNEAWSITGLKLETLHQTGNTKLLEEANQRRQ